VKHVFEDGRQNFIVQMNDKTIYTIGEGKRLAYLWWQSYGDFKQVEWMDLNPIAEQKKELIHYFKDLESLDGNPINIPLKILKRYLHHFNPENIKQSLIEYNPWPKLKPYIMPIIDYFRGP